jgi:hypothetical protein
LQYLLKFLVELTYESTFVGGNNTSNLENNTEPLVWSQVGHQTFFNTKFLLKKRSLLGKASTKEGNYSIVLIYQKKNWTCFERAGAMPGFFV